MTKRRLIFVAAFTISARAAPALAADPQADEPSVSPIVTPEQAPPAPSEEQPPPPPPVAPPIAPPPPPAAVPAAPVAVAPPPDPDHPSAHPNPEDKWPTEVVLRPLTLPGRMVLFGLQVTGNRPKNHVNVDPPTGAVYTFNSSVASGLSVTVGVTDRFQVEGFAPELACFATATPSGCDGINAHTGTGGSLRFLALRDSGVQIAPHAGISVARTSPTVYRWSAGSALKYTLSDEVAFFGSPAVARNINPAPARPANPWLAYLPAELEVQAAHPVVLFAVVEPWGSIGDVARGILLEVYGGASYTFGRLGEITFDAGTYNVLSQPVWNTNVPEWFASLSLDLWTTY